MVECGRFAAPGATGSFRQAPRRPRQRPAANSWSVAHRGNPDLEWSTKKKRPAECLCEPSYKASLPLCSVGVSCCLQIYERLGQYRIRSFDLRCRV